LSKETLKVSSHTEQRLPSVVSAVLQFVGFVGVVVSYKALLLILVEPPVVTVTHAVVPSGQSILAQGYPVDVAKPAHSFFT
jgi:hypothetical protein